MEGENGKRMIELLCPSVSKAVQIIAGEDQKVDLGSIARVFGLDPITVKLNGYFISRGADLIAYSVTWKSLIRFFSSRGLPTGATTSAALLVHGSQDVEDGRNGIVNMKERGYSREDKRTKLEHCGSPCNGSDPCLIESNSTRLKRKWQLDDQGHLKRIKSDDTVSSPGHGAFPNGRFSCSIISKSLKRMRVDEMVAPQASKKIR